MARRAHLWMVLTPTASFRNALGQLIIQWAYFEEQFDGLLYFVRLEPNAPKYQGESPYQFETRADKLVEAADIAFANCPPLRRRIKDIVTEALNVKQDRDDVTHCTWTGDAKDGHLLISGKRRGKRYSRELTVDYLHETSVKISALSRRVGAVQMAPLPSDYSFPLTEEERSALLDFRGRNQPRPATPVWPPPIYLRRRRTKKRP